MFVLIAGLAGFIAGFLVANSMNRSAMDQLKASAAPASSAASNSAAGQKQPELGADEIKSKIAQADANPGNFAFQKDLGTALYKYSTIKQDIDLLGESAKLLERANSLAPADTDVLTALGNAKFDLGYAKKDPNGFAEARKLYQKVLDVKPDLDVETDMALTWFYQDQPDYQRSAAELEKVTAADPTHQRALEYLVQAYLKQNKPAEAETALAKLKKANSSDPMISDLQKQIAGAKGAPPA